MISIDCNPELLTRILWIGGAPDSGKTTIAALLCEKYSLPVYHFDRHEMAHFARANPHLYPALWTMHPDRMGPEERWLGSPPEEMARATIASWSERVPMALDDLADLPGSSTIIAEGPGFFPAVIASLLPDPSMAVWLVPTEAFKRASVERRDKLRGVPVSDHARAVENLTQRDLLLGEAIVASARSHRLAVIEIDGAEPIAEVAARIETLFSPWLTNTDMRSEQPSSI